MKQVWNLCIALAMAACGNNSNDQTGSNDTTSAAAGATDSTRAALELVFSDSAYQLTGVAVEAGGRVWVNYPLWSDKYRYAVVTAHGADSVRPYPDTAMNSWKQGQPGKDKWVCVQSVYVDDGGTLWVLDPAAPRLKNITGGGAKLVRMNKATGKPERSYSFNGVVPDTAYMNDIRVDVGRQYAYLTESKGGGIVVINLATGKMRRLLSNHYSVKSDPAFKFIIDGKELMKDGKPAKFNSDGIALTPDGEWIYYKPLTDDKLYRIKTSVLRDSSMADSAVEKRVEDLGHFVTTDGMICDAAGNLYLGDLQRSSIVRISPNLKMTTLVADARLIWPDSYAIADGYLYISCSQIQKQPEYNNGVNKRTAPYTVYRVRL